MKFNLNLHELILLVGFLLSILLAFVFGINVRIRLANVWITGFLLASAIVFMVKFLYSTGLIVQYPHWFKLNFPAGILRPVFFYLYIIFLLDLSLRFRLKTLLHFIPLVVLLAYLMPFFLRDSSYKTDVLFGRTINDLGILPNWYGVFQFLYSAIYLVLAFYALRLYKKDNPRLNREKKTLIRWVRLILTLSVAFILITSIMRIVGWGGAYNIYAYDLFSFLLIVMCIRLMTVSKIVGTKTESKYDHSSLSEKDMEVSFGQMSQLMKEKRLYKEKDLKLASFAQSVSIPVNQVSQIINESTGKSFSDYVNEFRVEEAKRILLRDHSMYTIASIGLEAGFKSRAAFYNAFKKHTGLTPSQYLNG